MFLYQSPKTTFKNTEDHISLQHFEVDIPGNIKKNKVSVLLNFLEISFQQNFLFYGTVGFFTCMCLHRSPKIALKNTQNSLLYSNLKLTFPEIFKNVSLRFSTFFGNFVSEKFSFYGTLGLLTCSSTDPRKPHSEPTELTSQQHFEVDIPGNFLK